MSETREEIVVCTASFYTSKPCLKPGTVRVCVYHHQEVNEVDEPCPYDCCDKCCGECAEHEPCPYDCCDKCCGECAEHI